MGRFYHKDNLSDKICMHALFDNASGRHVEIGLLIGLNCASTGRPRDIICGKEDEPYTVGSALGWHVNGSASHRSSKQVHCNQIQSF